VAANEVRGVQPLACTAELLVDLVNRVPQLVPFLFELMLKLINIFVCAHEPRHPATLGLLAKFLGTHDLSVQQRRPNAISLSTFLKMQRGVSARRPKESLGTVNF
jgi:hypothetical protein